MNPDLVSTSVMISGLTLVVVMLDACIDVVAVLYWASKGYLGHPRRNGLARPVASVESYAAPPEQPVEAPAAVATTEAEPAPFQIQAIYETVQPNPAPVHFALPSTTSFGAPSISRPTKSYRRRLAPVRSTAASKASLKPKTKKP